LREYARKLRNAIENGDKRHSARSPWVVEMRGSFLSPLEAPEGPPTLLQGMTNNIARGGVGVLSDWLVPANAVLRCEFAIFGSPANIPTLMRVRWSDKVEGKRQYRLGLEFLF